MILFFFQQNILQVIVDFSGNVQVARRWARKLSDCFKVSPAIDSVLSIVWKFSYLYDRTCYFLEIFLICNESKFASITFALTQPRFSLLEFLRCSFWFGQIYFRRKKWYNRWNWEFISKQRIWTRVNHIKVEKFYSKLILAWNHTQMKSDLLKILSLK